MIKVDKGICHVKGTGIDILFEITCIVMSLCREEDISEDDIRFAVEYGIRKEKNEER